MDYTTIIEPVLEITLAGSADDTPWRDLLRDEGLPMVSAQGQAQILVSAVDSRYRGIRFQELSLSVQVDEQQYFLVHAYNSRALFALAERAFFQTPYYPGRITAQPRQLGLRVGSTPVFEATLAAEVQLAAEQWECQELQIFLPKRLRKRPDRPHFFHARLEGSTEIYREGLATGPIHPLPRQPVWGMLQASGFQAHEWRVRHAARHSKSKTYHEGTG